MHNKMRRSFTAPSFCVHKKQIFDIMKSELYKLLQEEECKIKKTPLKEP